jgi:hypothetical protein
MALFADRDACFWAYHAPLWARALDGIEICGRALFPRTDRFLPDLYHFLCDYRICDLFSECHPLAAEARAAGVRGLLQGSPNRQLYLPLTAALSGEFGHKAVRVVNLRKSFAKSTHVDGNRAVPRGIVSKISAQRLLVPVENQPHDLAGAVDDRRA